MPTTGWKKAACVSGHVNPARYKSGACIACQRAGAISRYRANRPAVVARSIARASADPEKRRDEQRASRLGVTVAEVRAAIAACRGKCQACGKEVTNATLCVDHCHETGRIRGILCRFCNALEGMLHKQRGRVESLLAYLADEIKKRKQE